MYLRRMHFCRFVANQQQGPLLVRIYLKFILIIPILLIAGFSTVFSQGLATLNHSRFAAAHRLFENKAYQQALYKYYEIYCSDSNYVQPDEKTPIAYPIALCLNKLENYALSRQWTDKIRQAKESSPDLRSKIRMLKTANNFKLRRGNRTNFFEQGQILHYLNDKQVNDLWEEGIELEKNKSFTNAIKKYKQAISLINRVDTIYAELFYRIASCYEQVEGVIHSADSCISYLTNGYSINPNYSPSLLCKTANSYHIKGDPIQSTKWAKKALKLDRLDTLDRRQMEALVKTNHLMEQQLELGLDLIKKPIPVAITNLGSEINSSASEHFPILSPDGRMLIYTCSKEGSIGLQDEDGEYDQDLWYIDVKDHMLSGKSTNMGPIANTVNNNGNASFTADGKYVFTTRCGEYDGIGNCDIYMGRIDKGSWKNIANIGTAVNSTEWDAQVCVSPDGRTLLWASLREGGYGKSDLWISHKGDDGLWKAAKNIGDVINTSGEEESPFISADGKTLYFSSNNLAPRIGGYDIYSCSILSDTSFSAPVNVGYPINSIYDDNDIFLTPSGKEGYFSSNRPEGLGDKDIYKFVLGTDEEAKKKKKQAAKPIVINSTIIDVKNRKSLAAKVKIEDVKTHVLTLNDTAAGGLFSATLESNKTYLLEIEMKGYLFYSKKIHTTQNSSSFTDQTIELQAITIGSNVVLNNLLFETGKFTLNESMIPELDKLFNLMIENPELRIELSGHTDNSGNEKSNLILSQNRANEVSNELIRRGIASTRIISKGYGSSKPIADNARANGRQQNRRIELSFIGN